MRFTFTPTRCSGHSLIEGFFSKHTRSVPQQIRVASKQELRERLMGFIESLNREPILHTWSYKIGKAG
jgi:hypothetical protein